MAKKMLIDATHAEETRVVVADGQTVEEFDFESLNKRQLAGNIYLAKVTRVEPSLQAAFVDYGGNRHGFLAFSEIHPDYFQIPLADREALLAQEQEDARAEAEEEQKPKRPRRRRKRKDDDQTAAETAGSGDAVARSGEIGGMDVVDLPEDEAGPVADFGGSVVEPLPEVEAGEAVGMEAQTAEAAEVPDQPLSAEAGEQELEAEADEDGDDDGDRPGDKARREDPDVDTVADDDAQEDIRPARKPRPRKYKIQEVVKVRQILLVQVVKEERGNKGAALTTYLSLAGRYCVLMPNTARGGGISRKITNAVDRKKLKEIATSLDVPQGAGLIVRTAGAKRTKTEIKRDYEYLQRQWEQVRELTLRSIAPAPIYEEGNLIHRSIRDLYNRDIDEVLVEGDAGYRQAKDFMKMIMPSHAKNVKHYTDPMPLFARHKVESYLADMFNPVVQLKSGGYIVIGITEALVAIDVNSGKATKEGSIEETATKTNLEAAEEVARQVRLRDLAGLIVIDFIDMDERRNNNAVEKRLKDKLKTDRARIQVGRISAFGLLEMSRQRLRPGMLEATTQPCPACHGTGLLRSDDSVALAILRQLEEEGTRRRSREVLVRAPVGIINFLINTKREYLAAIEVRYGLSVRLEADPHMVAPDYKIEKFKTATRKVSATPIVSMNADLMDAIEEEDEAPAEEERVDAPEEEEQQAREGGDEGASGSRRKRRRRRGGRGRSRNGDGQNGNGQNGDGQADDDQTGEAAVAAGETEPSAPQPVDAPADVQTDASLPADAAMADDTDQPPQADAEEEKPKRRRRVRSKRKPADEAGDAAPAEPTAAEPSEPVEATDEPAAQPDAPAAEPEPEPVTEAVEEQDNEPDAAPEPEPEPEDSPEPEPVAGEGEDEPSRPKRRGWWSLGS